MPQFIFVRHGETAHNATLVITSASPGAPLNEAGLRQVRDLAESFRGRDIAAIYSSPMLRATQTARILAQALPGVSISHRNELRECSVGDLEGRGDPEAFARFDSTWDYWYLKADLSYALGPNGETGEQSLARVAELVEALAAEHDDDETVIVVSHGTLLQLALTYMSRNIAPEQGFKRWIPNAGTVVLDVRDGKATCREWAGTVLPQPLTIGLVTSGRGTMLRYVLDACATGLIQANLTAVVSNIDCPALAVGKERAVPHTSRFDAASYASKADRDHAMGEFLRSAGVDLVLVAGYNETLAASFIDQFPRRVISPYPSLLPAFGNLNEAIGPALAYGVRQLGMTIHHHAPDSLSDGEILAQQTIPVTPDDTIESVIPRLTEIEMEILWQVINTLAGQ